MGMNSEKGSSALLLVASVMAMSFFLGRKNCMVTAKPRRILLDTDVDTDDFFALLYILKQNRSEFDLKAVTISANAWSEAGHAVNHVYDLLYMMNRDDVAVGVGGDGGISDDGSIIFPDVGGFLPLIEQGMSTVGDCRYRQAIPVGSRGRLDIDTNYGLRRAFLPQGKRRYVPLHQPTAQRVMLETISAGPTTLFLIGSHTNAALFLMTNPRWKKNIDHIYIMGGGIRSENPTGCCPADHSSSCIPLQCGDHGNLFTAYATNPFAEFNIFSDPFAAYQVFHSGIPITLVPLDATNTVPINEEFFRVFQQRQETFEAQYCFRSLKIIRDTWLDDHFYTSYFMWDSFLAAVAISSMRDGNDDRNADDDNEFAVMEYLNVTVVTSNAPFGVDDGSNPFFHGRAVPKFDLQNGGVHSGHVQVGLRDPFCLVDGSTKGKCQDGYTKEVTGSEAVQVRVAKEAKPNRDSNSPLNRQFFQSFLDVLNLRPQSGKFSLATQFPFYREMLYEPANSANQTRGKAVVFDMDMSAGDFLALIYLLKAPMETINLMGILVSGNGWATAATIDIIYDVLHMMGRDDIPVGLGNLTALGTPVLGCQYAKAIPQGSGGLLDSDTLYGLARSLPRSPRRYTAENSCKFGAPRKTALALEVWEHITTALSPTDKVTLLTNGPLTNLANIIDQDRDATRVIQDVYVVGGQVMDEQNKRGNVFTVPTNKFAEFNMFLDPLAAKKVMESNLSITLIPLSAQQRAASFARMLRTLKTAEQTPESNFAQQLLLLLNQLVLKNPELYHHMDIFLGEILGAVVLVDQDKLNTRMETKPITVLTGDLSRDGQIAVDRNGKLVHILDDFDSEEYYEQFANLLGDKQQSAVIGSFDEQTRIWSTPPK
ncbi:nucleoside hydrolase 3-like [Curcuma longa]|uniref:nucleoside hydrolase 3-like n=1 Tax=Curcuma longa TaxID=136217 RepID=UPI003D9F3718